MRRAYVWPLVIVCGAVLVWVVLQGNGRLWGQDIDMAALLEDSPGAFIFTLELTGGKAADYSECSGLGSSNDVEETLVQTGTGVITQQKTPGALQWHNITLKRVGPSGAAVWSWRKSMDDGKTTEAIRSGAIVLYQAGSSQPLARWDFARGWVASLSLDGSIETLTIVHDGLLRTDAISSTAKKR
jgi:phage tail-like protein